jgi:hypothetical protein
MPLFAGHRQPRVPRNGYYSLSDFETFQGQAEQAVSYGVDGFSIYHYWYEGVRPLATPLDNILKEDRIGIDFAICWANHSWTRSWRNNSGALDVLIEQTYESNLQSRLRHYEFLCRVFSHKNYLKSNGKPFMQIYRPEDIPNLADYLDGLRNTVSKRLGTELHLSAMITGWRRRWDYLKSFDSVTLFQPSLALFSPINIFNVDQRLLSSSFLKAWVRDSPISVRKVMYAIQDLLPEKYQIFNYDDVWKKTREQSAVCSSLLKMPVYSMGFVDFDNTPRYKRRAKVFVGEKLESFRGHLEALYRDVKARPKDSEFLFINAWNEWGEGMYLEPDSEVGFQRLEAVSAVALYESQSRSTLAPPQ